MIRNRFLAAALTMLLLLAQAISPVSGCMAEENQKTQPPAAEEAALYTQYLQQKGYSEILSYSNFEDAYLVEATEALVDSCRMTACLIDLNRDGVCELLIALNDDDRMSRSALMTIEDGAVKLIAAAGDDGGTIGGSQLELKYNPALQEYAVVRTSVMRDGRFAFINCMTIYSNDALFDSHDLYRYGYDLSSYYSEEAEKIQAETDRYLIEDGYLYSFMLDDAYITYTLYGTLAGSFVDPENPDALIFPGSYSSPITGKAVSLSTNS